MEKKPLAIFDVDGTIFRSSMVIEFVDRLVDEGVFPKTAKKEFDDEYDAWAARRGDYADYIKALVASFMKHLKGVHYREFATVAERVIEEEGERLYRFTRDLVTDLKNDDYYLLAISQSPKTVLEGFCRNLGFDKVYGRIYELGPSDRFTGAIEEVHLIENKANIVRRVLEREDVTLEHSIGVGDTEGDIPFLEMVETPICFNPNQQLYKQARRMGWKVVVERKDVIYEL